MIKTVKRYLQVELDDDDQLILKLLSYTSSLSISQIRTSITITAHKNIPSMVLVRKLDKLCLLGDVIRSRKNSNVYAYSLAKQ
jgi:hypothetical protein